MRHFLLLATAAVVTASPASADQVGDALAAKAEACIRSEASTVSRMTPNPNEAVSFLVGDLCSVEIQHVESYEMNSRMLTQLQANLPAPALKGVSVDPATGEIDAPPGFSPPIGVATNILTSTFRSQAQTRARFAAFAARAVLSAKSAKP
jgi:hypothetical protein